MRIAFFALLLVACAPAPPEALAPVKPGPPPAEATADDPTLVEALEEAAAGVGDESLRAMLREHWRWVLERQPTRATRLGVHAFDDKIGDESEEAIHAARARRDVFLSRARAIDAGELNEGDQITLALFIEELESWRASDVCAFEKWSLSPRNNHVTRWNNLRELHKVESARDGDNLVKRYQAIAKSIDDETGLLRKGAAEGLFATAESLRRIIAMVDRQLAMPLDEWPMLEPARKEHADWPAETLATYRAGLRAAVSDKIKPALARWGALLKNELLPKGRSEDKSGLVALPQGKACYEARILSFTTLNKTAKEIHAIGLAEIERIDAEFVALGAKAFKTGDLASTLAKLRDDKALYFTTEDEVEGAAQKALDEAKAKMASYFGILPKADCVMRRVPDYEAPYTTIAYYRPPHADGSKPGEYFINTYQPTTRPRYEARVLAIHEAIPGHHLQIAISQELPALPAFRKHGGFTAFVEGWALYTERLGEEMGLYRDDLDRFGMLSFDAWRAGRLVVDTGMHAMGWSRGQAKAFLEKHTALAKNNIDNEVDRYVSWPGQALAYKLGQREIAALRARAQEQLGERFSLPSFHDAVLSIGAVSLPVLRAQIDKFIQRKRKK